MRNRETGRGVTIVKATVKASKPNNDYDVSLCFDRSGKFLPSPFSSGTCEASEAVCSHQVAVLMLCAAIQQVL